MPKNTLCSVCDEWFDYSDVHVCDKKPEEMCVEELSREELEMLLSIMRALAKGIARGVSDAAVSKIITSIKKTIDNQEVH